MRHARAFVATAVLIACLAALPLSAAAAVRGVLASAFKAPAQITGTVAQWGKDLWFFRRNAEESRLLRRKLAEESQRRFQILEVRQENERLSRLVEMKPSLHGRVRRTVFCRVIGRSPASWNRVFLVDKGSKDGLKPNMLVLSGLTVVGKLVEVGPTTSKVLLVTDPNSRMAVLVQRTRDQGVLYGALGGGCRVKYLSTEARLKSGDVVETAGFGGFFPKGFLIGNVTRVWKEPGQVYLVAEVKPAADLGRLEEVICVE